MEDHIFATNNRRTVLLAMPYIHHLTIWITCE